MFRSWLMIRSWLRRGLAFRLALLLGVALALCSAAPLSAGADPAAAGAGSPFARAHQAAALRSHAGLRQPIPALSAARRAGVAAAQLRRGIPGAIAPQAGATISGVVELPNHAAPAQPQDVWLLSAPDGSAVAIASTLNGGSFSFSNVAAGSYSLLVIPGDNTAAGALTNKSVAVPNANPVNVGTLTLPTAPNTLTGSVTRAGQPVANATVVAYNLDVWQYSRRSVTGPSGTYTLNVSGDRWVAYVESNPNANWYYGGQSFDVAFFGSVVTHDFVVLPIDGHIIGQIVDANGNPTSFPSNTAALDVRSSNDNSTGTVLANNGHFDIPAAAGLYTYSAWLSSAEPAYQNLLGPPNGQVELVAGTVDLGKLRLRARNATISGTVSDQNGPIELVDVIAWNADGDQLVATTTPNGAYQLQVTPGAWSVQPSLAEAQRSSYLHTSSLTQQLEVIAGQSATADFALEQAADTVGGTIVDATTGQVRADAEGWAYLSRPNAAEWLSATPIVAGAFSLPAPAENVVVWVALSSDSQLSIAEPAQTVPAQGPRTATFQAQLNGAVIAGKIVDGAGQPVLGVDGLVVAEAAGARDLFRYAAINPQTGAYTLNVPAGDWIVSYYLYSDAYQADPNTTLLVHATEGTPQQTDLPLVALDGQLEIVVLDAQGVAVPNTLVWAAYDNQEVYGVTDANGFVTLFLPYSDSTPAALGAGRLIAPQGRQRPPVRIGTASQNSDTERGIQPKVIQCKDTPAVCASRRNAAPQVKPVSQRNGGSTAQLAAAATPTMLQLRTANSALAGVVVGPGGAPQPGAYISAWSSDAQWVSGVADSQGAFSLPVIREKAGGTVWTIAARDIDNPANILVATQKQVITAPVADAAAPIAAGSLALAPMAGVSPPKPQSHSFTADQGLTITLADQTEISIPKNAIAAPAATQDQAIRATVSSQVQLPSTDVDQLASFYGYEINLYDQQNGDPLNQPLAQNALITFHYSEATLRQLGVTERELRPAWFDTEQASWRIADGFLIDTSANTVTVQTKQLNNWALVASQSQTQLFLPLVQR